MASTSKSKRIQAVKLADALNAMRAFPYPIMQRRFPSAGPTETV